MVKRAKTMVEDCDVNTRHHEEYFVTPARTKRDAEIITEPPIKVTLNVVRNLLNNRLTFIINKNYFLSSPSLK